VDSMYSEFTALCDDVEKLSCSLEESENSVSRVMSNLIRIECAWG